MPFKMCLLTGMTQINSCQVKALLLHESSQDPHIVDFEMMQLTDLADSAHDMP